MNKALVIRSTAEEVEIALLEDKQLVELHREKKTATAAVGDIYLGKIKKIMPGLNAAFVDLGDEKDGFVHYLDLGPNYNTVNRYLRQAMNGDRNMRTLTGMKTEETLPKAGSMSDTLQQGQLVLLQVTKEPISTKGPKLTGDLSLAGRYLVLVPFGNKISISQKIKGNEERSRLRRLMHSIKPEGFGVIVRTMAEERSVADLDADLRSLCDRWAAMTDRLKAVTSPQKVLSELSKTTALLRDILSDEFDEVYCDSEELYDELRQYIRSIAPDRESVVKYYRMETPIFDQFGISRDIRRAFGRIVTIRSGVYLYVEHTEAMHVIDVNSGNHIKAGSGQEDTALQVNMESAKEIARQLRLRDMGGIIIIDFVDMNKAEHRKALFDYMTQVMAPDKARHTILPLSKFGLMQITRQRVRPAVEVDVQEKCPFCDGTGTVRSTLVVVDEIEQDLRYLTASQRLRSVMIQVHPYINAYLRYGMPSMRMRWMWKYRCRVQLKPLERLNLLEYKFLNGDGEEIFT